MVGGVAAWGDSVLDLREGVLEKYLYENANAVLFGEREPRYGEFRR